MSTSQNTNQVAQRPKPILMIPIRRCGSHALRLRLNFSPDFYSPYPLHIVDFMPLVELYGDLSNDYTYFQLVIDLIGLQNATMVKWDNVALDPISVFEAVKNRPRSVHSIAWEMLFQAGQKHNAKVVMDKSLDNVHYAEELISLFDDLLFLHVVRDPRAQVNSINRAIIHDFDTLLNTLTWVKAQDAAKDLAQKYPDKVLTIRYEDFLVNQEAVLRKICQFFGIEFLNSMLDVSASQEAKNISVLSALWQTNSSPPIPAYIDKFKKSMSMDDIEIIETIAGDYMDYYGYEKMTPAKAKITEEMSENLQARSEVKKQRAWIELRENAPQDYQLRKFRATYLNMLKARLLQDKPEELKNIKNVHQMA
ncbi:sulfotransferase [Allocoleopsis franciscana]|uniref:Sulfotransferase family protein n=1 Tax=Allocoleopsis franciscana PCC 7113 TaxID=1173027 RepID=K9WMU1_9CYAN|nr:sulfotransferase [Allocoleopsis franciscana]AFZ21096.1 sulfotransferase family protein [Allocoleopsis franciscana PCC 7113]